MKIIAFLILIPIFLSGCTKEESAPVIVSEPAIESIDISVDKELNTFVETDTIGYGMYEHEKGCVLGAYILGDSNIEDGISEFESVVGEKFGYIRTI